MTPVSLALLAQATAGAEPRSWSDVLRHDVVPVASAYVVVVAMLAARARERRRAVRSDRRRVVRLRAGRPQARPSWRDLFGYVAGTALGGYLLFLVIVLTYYFALGGEDRRFVVQAFREGSVLAFVIVVPAFLLISWAHDRRGPGETARRKPPIPPLPRADRPAGRSGPG